MMPIPHRMAYLPLDELSLPVPWYAAWTDGVPDLATAAPGRLERALAGHRCWHCGQRLDHSVGFICEPVQAALRVAVAPPSHPDCATYAAAARSRSAPGVTVAVITHDWRIAGAAPGQVRRRPLFRFGEPEQMLWFRFGREASRAEALDSLGSVAVVISRRRAGVESGDLARIRRWLPDETATTLPPEKEIVT